MPWIDKTLSGEGRFQTVLLEASGHSFWEIDKNGRPDFCCPLNWVVTWIAAASFCIGLRARVCSSPSLIISLVPCSAWLCSHLPDQSRVVFCLPFLCLLQTAVATPRQPAPASQPPSLPFLRYGRHSLDPHPQPSPPTLPQPVVVFDSLAASPVACAGIADVHPECLPRSPGATAFAAAHAHLRGSDAPGSAERMDLLQQGLCRPALDGFRQSRHCQAGLQSTWRQKVTPGLRRRRAHPK